MNDTVLLEGGLSALSKECLNAPLRRLSRLLAACRRLAANSMRRNQSGLRPRSKCNGAGALVHVS